MCMLSEGGKDKHCGETIAGVFYLGEKVKWHGWLENFDEK